MEKMYSTNQDDKNIKTLPNKAIHEAQNDFEEHLANIFRVEEDGLEDLNLGSLEKPKNVKIRVNLTSKYRLYLYSLLMEFKNVFEWHYKNKKGVDPQFFNAKSI